MGHAGDSHDDEPLDEHHGEESDRPRGSPPDPLDRLWRHPTELPPITRESAGGRRPPTWLTAAAAGAAGAILTVVALAAGGSFDESTPNSAGAPLISGQAVPRIAPAEIGAAVGESVVSVTAHTGQGMVRGSGVCVRHEGDILTSSRLLADATRIEVTAADGTVHQAKVTGRDPTTDLALLSIDADVSAAELSEDELFSGSAVWIVAAPAIGSRTPWMSGGMVSTTDALVAHASGPTTDGLVETDAAANSSASGGALVDTSGAVAGIVLSPVDDGRTTHAVPIATAVVVAEDLRRNGVAAHGSLGVEGIDSASGPTVTRLRENGAAARAGLQANDVITRVADRRVTSMAEVMAIVRRYSPGQTVVVHLVRGEEALKVDVELDDLNPPPNTTTTAAGIG